MKHTGLRRMGTLMATLAGLAGSDAAGQFGITRTFSVAEAIPDGGELIQVGAFDLGGATIASVGVTLKVDGASAGTGFNGDLYATLIHSTGFSVLLNRPGRDTLTGLGYSDSGLDILLKDGAPDVHGYRRTLNGSDQVPLDGPLTGTWSPDGRETDPASVVFADPRTAGLGGFSGLDLAGEWILFLADLITGSEHRLNRWGLDVETAGGFTGPVGLVNDSLRAVGAARTLPNPVSFTGEVGLTGVHDLTFTGNATLQGSVRLRVENASALEGGVTASGPGVALTKTGAGTLTLSGAGNYTGGTVIEQGTLRVRNAAGSATGSGLVSVLAGATFGGWGRIDGPVLVGSGAVLAPERGGTPLRTGPQTWNGGGLYRFEISGASPVPGNTWSQVDIAGSLTLAATAANPFRIEMISLTPGGTPGPVADFNPTWNYFWPLATASEGVSGFDPARVVLDPGAFLGLASGAFGVEKVGNTLGISYIAVPEPATWATVSGLLLLGGGWATRFRRRPTAPSRIG